MSSLAVVVISLRAEPGLPAAVASLLAQDPVPEVVVANSGGGDPAAALAARGIHVPVKELPERRFAGAVCNLGVAATSAPVVGFMSADCLARPGWVAARLRAHDGGATVVAGALAPTAPATPAAWAQHLLLHHRRRPETAPDRALLYGMSIARPALERHGPFREDLRIGEDTEYRQRLVAAKESIAFTGGAVIEHRYADTPRALVRDQFRRGRMASLHYAQHEWRKPRQVAARNIRNIGRAAAAWRRVPVAERPPVHRVFPLLAAGGLACAAGALSASGRGTRA